MSQTSFDFQKFFADTLQILVSPTEYFTKKTKSKGLGDPIIRAVLCGVTAGIINIIWGLLNLVPQGGWFGGFVGSGIGIMALIFTAVGSVIILFIGGVIVLVLSAICGGSSDFEASMDVMAASMIIIPIRALIGAVSGLSFFAGTFVSLLISLYGIFLIYKGLVHTLKCKKTTARILTLLLSALPVLFLLGTLVCVGKVKNMSRETKKFMEQLPQSDREMKEKYDRLKNMMKETEKTEKKL